MSKFDTTIQKKAVKTTNHVGAVAYEKSAKFELITTLLTSFVEDNYYKSKGSTLSGLSDIVAKVDPMFAAKAAVFARTKFGMRSISHAVASELAKHLSGKEWAKDFYNAIVYRPDDILEILSYHFGKKQKLSKAMQKGLATAVGKFDAYQLAKYKGEDKTIKLVDAINILHPIATQKNGSILVDKDVYWNALSDKQKKEKNIKLKNLKKQVEISALDALMMGLLKSEGTWEADLSAAGQNAKDDAEKAEFKKDVWVNLIQTRKIGYFALLRNLRNIITQAPEAVDGAIEMLTNQKLIKKSLVLPFRFLSAYETISAMKPVSVRPAKKSIFEHDNIVEQDTVIDRVLDAIDQATKLSVENIPLFKGKTVILSDNSGSMTGDGGGSSKLSSMTSRKTSDIANLFAVLCWLRSENTAIGLFGDRLIEPKLDRNRGVFDNFNLIDVEKNKCGASTEEGIFVMFKKLIAEKIMVDRIVIFSDCQIGSAGWYGTRHGHGSFDKLYQEYRTINPDFMCYSIDLKNYRTTVFDKGVVKLSGFSDKIFDIMSKMESDNHSLVKEIESINFTQVGVDSEEDQ